MPNAFLRAFGRMNEVTRTVGAITGVTFVSFLWVTFSYSRGEHVKTITPEFQAANLEYRKYQNMNPIFGNQ